MRASNGAVANMNIGDVPIGPLPQERMRSRESVDAPFPYDEQVIHKALGSPFEDDAEASACGYMMFELRSWLRIASQTAGGSVVTSL